jgi:regulator of protease activity HflC (stomatin/prohibitin superfamily)
VEFITVQIQSASPPEEVVTAIKDRMVAVQRQEQAQAEAAQRRTLADADYYAAQKAAEGEAYQITMLAEAEAERIALTSAAQQEAVRAILAQLAEGGELAEAYIQVLIAQELQENSKWIISGGGDAAPVIELREAP